ncbi:MAG: hypothetical protein ACI9YB_002255, partial [Halioglobus sp.]
PAGQKQMVSINNFATRLLSSSRPSSSRDSPTIHGPVPTQVNEDRANLLQMTLIKKEQASKSSPELTLSDPSLPSAPHIATSPLSSKLLAQLEAKGISPPEKGSHTLFQPYTQAVLSLASEKIEGGKSVQHLFLRANVKYITDFCETASSDADPAAKEAIAVLLDKNLQTLLGSSSAENGVYDSDWLSPLADDQMDGLMVATSTDDEGARQKDTTTLMNQTMYQVMNLACPKDKDASSEDHHSTMAAFHREICSDVAVHMKDNITNQEGQVEIDFNSTVTNGRGDTISVHNHLLQATNTFQSSLAKRGDESGVINAHTDSITVTIGTDDGQKTLVNHELRTGSFDFSDVDSSNVRKELAALSNIGLFEKEQYMNMAIDPTDRSPNPKTSIRSCTKNINLIKNNPIKLAKATKHLSNVLKNLRSEYLLASKPVERMNALKKSAIILEELKEKFPSPSANTPEKVLHSIEKLSTDLYGVEQADGGFKGGFLEQEAILRKNRSVAESFLTNQLSAHGSTPLLTVPHHAQVLFKSEFAKKKVAMFSLQTPANITNKGAIKKKLHNQLAKLHKKMNTEGLSKLEKKAYKGLKEFLGPDISELDPIFREMKGFRDASNNLGEEVKTSYINLPTNVLGRTKIGGIKLSSLFNVGTVDKTKSDEVEKEKQKGLTSVFKEAKTRIEGLKSALTRPNLTHEQRKDYETYLSTLQSLVSEIFVDPQSDNPESLELKPAPGGKAFYEVPARLNTLFKSLGYVTTFHCRSGNNRTAVMASKSHQLATTLASSTDGSIPSSDETAGKLAKKKGMLAKLKGSNKSGKSNHWSKQLFLQSLATSLTLQQANKGTEGTKVKDTEFGNGTTRNAFTLGAFQIAGRYDEDMMTSVIAEA